MKCILQIYLMQNVLLFIVIFVESTFVFCFHSKTHIPYEIFELDLLEICQRLLFEVYNKCCFIENYIESVEISSIIYLTIVLIRL